MAYTKAQDVRSPRGAVGFVQVLVDQGPCPAAGGAGRWSLAVVGYCDEPRVGIRWNGYDNEKDGSLAGHPQSRGNPTWFLLPCELEGPVLAGAEIPKDKLAIAKALLGQREAV